MGAHRLQQEYPVALTWTAFPLHPEIPEEGMDLADLFAGRAFDLDAAQRRLRAVAAEVGVPLADRRSTSNSRRAQELGKWAEALGAGGAFHAAVYRAHFVEGRNIARPEELAALAAAVGLPADEARRVLEEGRFRAAVDADWRRSRDLGVRAVPTFLIGGRRIEGFRPYEELARLAEQAGAERAAPAASG